MAGGLGTTGSRPWGWDGELHVDETWWLWRVSFLAGQDEPSRTRQPEEREKKHGSRSREPKVPRSTKPIHAGECSWGIILLREYMRGQYSHSREYRKIFWRSHFPHIHAQYDWTTGGPDNGNEWRKFRAVPRLYPLRSLVCTLFNKGGSRGALRLPGAGGDHFHCTVEPSPGHIRCRT